MNNHLTDACEDIDAALFTGDSFLDSQNRKELRDYIDRWICQLDELQGMDDDALSDTDDELDDASEDDDEQADEDEVTDPSTDTLNETELDRS